MSSNYQTAREILDHFADKPTDDATYIQLGQIAATLAVADAINTANMEGKL